MNQAELARAEPEVRDYRLKSTPKAVRATLRTLRADLERLGISDDDLNSIELVVAEVLNNVTEHAYPPMHPGRIEMQLVDDGHNLTVTVGDFGIEMPGGTPPEGRAPPGDCAFDDLPEGGFGWFLIRTISSDLRYERSEDRNELSFQIVLGPRKPLR